VEQTFYYGCYSVHVQGVNQIEIFHIRFTGFAAEDSVAIFILS
jgi:hypothetical protein